MKTSSIFIIILTVTLFGCLESDIVDRYSSDQVEQLLTDGDIKTWYQSELIIDGVRQSIEECQDTLRWVFEYVDTDSITSYELAFNSECVLYDTTFLGSFSASSFDEAFTDSLKFEGGNKTYMTPSYIRSSSFSVNYIEGGQEINATFEETRSDFLARQVGYLLSGGIDAGDTDDWSLTALEIDGIFQSFSNCSDTLLFRFSRSGNTLILNELETDTLCINFANTYIGEVEIPIQSAEGFFEDEIQIESDVIGDLTITSFEEDAFSAQYTRDNVLHEATYQNLN